MVLCGGTCRVLVYSVINALFSAPRRTLRGRIPARSPHLPIEATRPLMAFTMRVDVKCLPAFLNHGCRWTCAYLRRNTSGTVTRFLRVPLGSSGNLADTAGPGEPACAGLLCVEREQSEGDFRTPPSYVCTNRPACGRAAIETFTGPEECKQQRVQLLSDKRVNFTVLL